MNYKNKMAAGGGPRPFSLSLQPFFLLAISFELFDRFLAFLHQNDLYNFSCLTNCKNKMAAEDKMTSHVT